jgi:hypothetical protein
MKTIELIFKNPFKVTIKKKDWTEQASEKQSTAQELTDDAESISPQLSSSSDERSLKNIGLICYGLSLVFIIAGVFLILLTTVNELDNLNLKHEITEKNTTALISPSNENKISYSEEHSINWGGILYLSIKSISILALLIIASSYSYKLAKAFINESFKISNHRETIFRAKLYLSLVNKSEEPLPLMQALNNCDLFHNSATTFDEKSLDPKHLDKALELICKVKGVVNSDTSTKQSSPSSPHQ